ncbi:ATP-binding protein [Ruminococcus sp. NSJ-71]|uniref:ATP-binding protein n=1 Tax=Ruminococcus intestinalis TaxID=2763066 RepID=A0ABR7HL56_9FIRM|nr:ATP-binding protein [Ruminococcus intestinalis]MBC5728275.1 ATP-binding protein [Ruminococcus intestinalis]
MTSKENQIINLIISQDENDQVDFKKEYYSKEKKYDLIKDIVSFANNIKPKDKYIVFGVENSTWNVLGIDRASLPDISEINNLLHSYVEPFIDVELGYLDYQGVTIGFIRIPHHDLNRPYVISKEYNKNKGVFLRKGEIYTRKGATNFIAERSDLDCIYHNKGTLDINLYTKELSFSNIRINGNSYLAGQVRCIIQNNTPKTIVIDSIHIFVHCGSNLIEHTVDFIDDQKSVFIKMPESLSQIPMQISSGDSLQKTVYFEISEIAAINLNKKANELSDVSVSIEIGDVLKRTYQNDAETIRLNVAEDLLKKWSH